MLSTSKVYLGQDNYQSGQAKVHVDLYCASVAANLIFQEGMVLQARWSFVYGPATTWDPQVLREVVTTHVMRNMVVEDDGNDLGNVDFDRTGHPENISASRNKRGKSGCTFSR